MEFTEYLNSKKIDAVAFKKADSRLYSEWERIFKILHPKSFTAQKLYLINDIRRKYTLQASNDVKGQQSDVKKVNKPKVKPVRPKSAGKPIMKRPKLK